MRVVSAEDRLGPQPLGLQLSWDRLPKTVTLTCMASEPSIGSLPEPRWMGKVSTTLILRILYTPNGYTKYSTPPVNCQIEGRDDLPVQLEIAPAPDVDLSPFPGFQAVARREGYGRADGSDRSPFDKCSPLHVYWKSIDDLLNSLLPMAGERSAICIGSLGHRRIAEF